MLKIIALISMIIDHIGFFWDINFFRIIGRISFPIYCFLITKGAKNTKDIKKYMLRVLALAIISQCVWEYVGIDTLNVLFTYFLFLQFLFFIKNKNYIVSSILFVGFVIISSYLDYGLYGFVLLFIFYYVEDRWVRYFLILGSCIHFMINGIIMDVSIIAVFSVFIIEKYDKPQYYKKYKKYNKLIYWMYPVHLIILFEIYKCTL